MYLSVRSGSGSGRMRAPCQGYTPLQSPLTALWCPCVRASRYVAYEWLIFLCQCWLSFGYCLTPWFLFHVLHGDNNWMEKCRCVDLHVSRGAVGFSQDFPCKDLHPRILLKNLAKVLPKILSLARLSVRFTQDVTRILNYLALLVQIERPLYPFLFCGW